MDQAYQPTGAPAVPAYERQPRFTGMPASPEDWRYHPPRTPSWWHRHRRTLRVLALAGVLALCGLMILTLVQRQTGTQGLLVGLALSVLPVPLLVLALRWLDAVEPTPWRNLGFALAWGACAATLISLLANSLTTKWLATSVVTESPTSAESLGTTVVAPVVEEAAKAAAILLLYLFRPNHFTGVATGIVIAGMTATGFAFTENVLYLGHAYGQDTAFTDSGGIELDQSLTAATFVTRIVFSPFAHPLFTGLAGAAFGLAAALPHRRRAARVLLPLVGLLTAIGLHAVWNAAATDASSTFLLVYALAILPALAGLVWLGIAARQRALRTVRRTLPAYAVAGWLSPGESWALASMRARAIARNLARRAHGPSGADTVRQYQHFATTLALLRARAERGGGEADFHAREQELLHHLWTRRALAAPPTERSAMALAHRAAPPPQRWGPPPGGGGPPGAPAGGYGHGWYGHGQPGAYVHGGHSTYGHGGYGQHGAYGASPPGA
ncbi:PrsW family intramembrane metalloprotease [Streptomyces oceani]|uniref:Peptidase n=1 Tax=Streptomyces oceani TaxID=1075402 RepID=A0A1E7JXL2_9ACTN|nr:PrsW family intramembrane metalloprotease [Streptomyces oceani]OEU96413.1 hypothetical protein AN216_20755 [Streptomyces oceani]